MKLVFASDSFKGTLSSARIGALLEEAAREVLPGAECVSIPVSDGGEGMLDALSPFWSGERVPLYVHNALMRPQRCSILVDGQRAFIEAASTCGLTQLSSDERNPMVTSSHGVGECIGHALYHGCTEISVSLGGSCTNDGGMGLLRALGMRFFDEDGNELPGRGADLARVVRFDDSGLFPQAREAEFTVLCDVDNPLLGPKGATNVFSAQKGADEGMRSRLEAGMVNFAEVIVRQFPEVDFDTPGFGAAGGLGMALSVFLGAQMRSGAEMLLDLIGFDETIADADLVVTGEGALDSQSLHGKIVGEVARHAGQVGVPAVAVCGKLKLDDAQVRELGLAQVVETSAVKGPEYAMEHAEEAFLEAARELFRQVAR